MVEAKRAAGAHRQRVERVPAVRRCVERGRRLGRSPSTALRMHLALPLLIALCACRSASESPEDQIRALIAKGEKAAEEKDLGTLREIIHDGYSDKQGNKKPELIKLLAYHLLRHQSVHLLTRIRTIEFPEPKRSEATVFVGMAAGSLGSIDDLLKMRADLYRVEVSLLDESSGDWKVASAAWRPAELSDFE
jgi:hypothetical protein